MPEVLVEVCCGSAEDALAAREGGADRVELCSALCVGGLTPSLGAIVEARAAVRIPIMVMIRPRAAGFRYGEREVVVMLRDIEAAVGEGADGVVFGALRDDGSVDEAVCRRLRKAAAHRAVVFHRAFDLTPDPLRSLEQLVDLGFARVLTSGQGQNALAGAPVLRRLIDQARDRIEVLPGGGIRAHNVLRLLAETGCRQIHLSAFGSETDPSTHGHPELSLLADHPPADQYARTDVERVREIVRTLRPVAAPS